MTGPTGPTWHTRYGPQQLRDLLGLTEWQHQRATAAGIIPGPDAPGGRWLGTTARRLWPLRVAIRRSAGYIPDVGEVRAAEHLATVTGIDVEPHALPELARQGLILVVGYLEKYHGTYPLYCGRTLEAWAPGDVEAIEAANVAGERLTVDRVTDRLGVRRSDVDALVRRGWLAPVDWARGPHTPKSRRPDVPLYRAGDLTGLLTDPTIDWDAARAVKAGARSPLATLPDRTQPDPAAPQWRDAIRAVLDGAGPVTLRRIAGLLKLKNEHVDTSDLRSALVALETDGFVQSSRPGPGQQQRWLWTAHPATPTTNS